MTDLNSSIFQDVMTYLNISILDDIMTDLNSSIFQDVMTNLNISILDDIITALNSSIFQDVMTALNISLLYDIMTALNSSIFQDIMTALNSSILQDIMTDLNAESELLPLKPVQEEWKGHKVSMEHLQPLETPLWANSFYKSKCPSVCPSLRVSVHF